MRRRRWIALSAAALLLLAAGLSLLEWHPQLFGRRSGGPLACRECGRTATGAPVRVGQLVSMGPLRLRNQGEETVTVERVELIDIDPGLDVVGMVVVEPDGRHPLVGGDHGYPPREPGGITHPVSGYRLPPARSRADFVQILVGLRLSARGRAGARKIAVDYRVGRVPYRAIFDHAMWLCADRKADEQCIDRDR